MEVGERYSPFLSEEAEPDCLVTFEPVAVLPEMSDDILYRDNLSAYDVAANGIRRFFYETPKEHVPYGMTVYGKNGKQIAVKYLNSKPYCVGELSKCFYHIGIEELMIRERNLCFHAACIETELGGILFSGPSGIGKSTQADLWVKHRKARQINGDRPVVSKNSGEWLAWGSPYAGSSCCYVNASCPISAIVMLRQASKCSIRKMSATQAFRAIWSGMTVQSWDAAFVETATELVLDMALAVPVYEYACTPDEYAVDYLEQALRKECGL